MVAGIPHFNGDRSVVTKRAAEARLRALIATVAPGHARVVGALRKFLGKLLPAFQEIVYEYRGFFVISFSSTGRGFEGVMAIRAGGDGARLCFNHGKDLPDPGKLLKGSGSQVRWMGLENPGMLERPDVAALVQAALGINGVPGKPAGGGSTVVRSKSPQKK